MQKVDIGYDSESIWIYIGEKRFYASEEIYEFAEMFAEVLKELGFDAEAEECY